MNKTSSNNEMGSVEEKQLSEVLGSIVSAEPSPFLLARIHARIREAYPERFSPRASWSLAATVLLVMLLNAALLLRDGHRQEMSQLGSAPGLQTDNALYP